MVKSESRGRDRSQGGARREALRAGPPCFGAGGMERRRQSVENRLKPRELTRRGGSWPTHQMDTCEVHPSPPWPPQHRKL